MNYCEFKNISRLSLIFLLLLLNTRMLQADDKNLIIQSEKYYYGSSKSYDVSEAKDRAVKDITEQISVRVESIFERKLIETGNELKEDVKSILRTHSTAILKNVKSIKTPQSNGQIEVFCYLSKQEVKKIWEERKRLICAMFQKAKENESIGNYAHSLKLYYFSLLLINSIPEQSVEYQGINYTTEIPEQINRIIVNTRFQIKDDRLISDKEREITLKVFQTEQPVALLDFTFWHGTSQISVQARDGLATFRLLGSSSAFDKLNINIKISYYDARNEYNIIGDLWELVKRPPFNSAKTVFLSGTPEQANIVESMSPKNWDLNLEYKNNIPVADKIIYSTNQFLNAISEGKRDLIKSRYKNDPFLRDKILNYLTYNHPKPLDKSISASLNKTNSGYELRKVRMLHQYPTINKQTTEYLVLDFSDKGELLDINMGITENLYSSFVEQFGIGRDRNNRQEIIKFIEKYRTSYLTRDIKTVDLMFAEDALILVGRKIERRKLPDDIVNYHKFDKQPNYEYIKLSKQKYIQRLNQVFNNQQDIFLDFGSFDITKKQNAKDVYGVEMRQSYTSTTYSDEGYLFLMVDFSEHDPIIHIRAWQPNEWSDSAMVRTANFKIYK